MGNQPALWPISGGVSLAYFLLCYTFSDDAMVSNEDGNRYDLMEW